MKGILVNKSSNQSFQGGAVGGSGNAGAMNATFAGAAAATAPTVAIGQQANNRNQPAGILKSTYHPEGTASSAGPGAGEKPFATPVVGFRTGTADKVGQKEQRIQTDFDEIVRQEKEREMERRKHVPADLGRDIYTLLCENYKEKKQLNVKDPQVLFDFWKVLNKSERQNSYKGEVVKPLTEREAKKLNVYELSLYRRKEKKFTMSVLARAHPQDVMLTLTTHHGVVMGEIEGEKEKQYQKRLEAKEVEKKKEEDILRELKNRQSDRMEQLSKNLPFGFDGDYDANDGGEDGDEYRDNYDDRQNEHYYGSDYEQQNMTPQQLEQQANERAKVDAQIREAFVEMIIVLFRKRYPMQRVYKNQEDLKQFWEEEIPDKQEKNLDVSLDQAHKYVDDYFFFKGLDFFLLRREKIGYDTFDKEELIEFFLTLNKGEKKRRGLTFESEADVIKMIEYYLERAKRQNEELVVQQTEQEHKRHQYFEKLKTQVLRGKEIQATDLKTLSMAKDRLLVGKSLLQLRHQYPQDKILRKMILDEFQENKVAKHPLEYDCNDEVTEAKIQERQLVEVHHVSGRTLRLADLHAPLNERTKVIASLFEEEIENYYYHMEDRVKQSQRDKADITTQMKALKTFLEQEAQRFIHLRKRRFTQANIPTVNEFLSTLYREAMDNPQFSRALHKHFPHSTAGQSKKLAQVSFPYSFKRFFFEVVRSYAADLHKDAITKLPFWAPSGKNYRTLNYKVKKLSRDAKNAQRWEQYCERMNSKRVWDNSDLISEKLKVMMTFEEAKECTFEPMVGLRAPLEMRGVLKSRQLEYGQSVHDLLFSRQPNFEKWVDRMGPDFRVQFPHVHKFGAYRRCLRYLSQSLYNEAATLLFETFQVEAIRDFFSAKPKSTSNPTTNSTAAAHALQPNQLIFSVERCTPDPDKVKIITRENFQDDTTRKFLEDVYCMVILPLDRYIVNLNKDLNSLDQLKKVQEQHSSINNYNNSTNKRSANFDASLNERLIEDNNSSSYRSRSQNPKSIICPLKENCPSVLNSRWPKGNTRNSVPTGANCEYAHSYAELKFVDEKKAKVKALTQRIEAIAKQLETGVDPMASSHWNPANNLFVKCTGCGPLGACSLCQMKKVNVKRINELKERSDAAYNRLANTKSVQVKQEIKQKQYESTALKVSSIQRANILFSKERFSEAFDVISKAALFVKEQLQEKELEDSQKQLAWSKKLNVPIESAKSLIAKRSVSGEKNAASITLFAEKTGLALSASHSKVDNDEFLNYQIQLLYLKIERQLTAKKKDIRIMANKIEKLEAEEINKQSSSSQQPLNAATLKLSKKHADLVSNERKIKNLQNAIQKTQDAMLNSTTPAPWNPTSALDAILDIDKLNEQNLHKNIHSVQAAQKSIYTRSSDDLVTNPLYRRDDEQYDSDDGDEE